MTDMERLRCIARQQVETARLLGVDFVPVNLQHDPDDKLAAGTPAGSSTPLRGRVQPQPQREAAPHAESSAPVPAGGDKTAALEALRDRHDSTCPHCTTATSHTRTVFGEGNPDADLMFVGEAPGEEEDRTGRPFVGRAGQKLDQMIQAMGLRREDVYIANVLKSRPPNNRAPLQPEIDGCSPFLVEQIRIIQPRVIVTLGGPATKLMLNTTTGITRLRGIWAEYVDPSGEVRVPVMPTFHPAYLLRNYTPETRKQVWSDLQAVMQAIENTAS